MKRIFAVLVAVFLSFPAMAQQGLFAVPSTPSIAVTATATADFVWTNVTGGYVDWVYIKNDCSAALWFDFRSKRDAVARQYPLKLAQNQEFQAYMRVYTLGVSPANSGTACTFTLLGAQQRQ